MDILTSVTVISSLWLIIISIFVLWIFKKTVLDKKGERNLNIEESIIKLFSQQESLSKNLSSLEKELDSQGKNSAFYIQKIGVTRFNPFAETGGDQSFSIALLDRNLSGIIITSLHTRNGNRLYAKPVEKGKSSYELSKEEQKALSEVKKL